MSTIIQAIEAEQMSKEIPEFHPGDTVAVSVKVKEGERERVFQTYSHQIAGIEVKRKGAVRRAKLYYLRGLTGKAARIKEKV